MKINLQIDASLSDAEISVEIKAAKYSTEVANLMEYLKNYSRNYPDILPLNTSNGIILVKVKEIEALEVNHNETTVYTLKQAHTVREPLYKLLQQLRGTKIIQISKSSAINLAYLSSLEAGFSGTMVAKLNSRKAYVSRSFIPNLKKELGL